MPDKTNNFTRLCHIAVIECLIELSQVAKGLLPIEVALRKATILMLLEILHVSDLWFGDNTAYLDAVRQLSRIQESISKGPLDDVCASLAEVIEAYRYRGDITTLADPDYPFESMA